MARSKEQNERMRESTREKIQTAAVALFAEKGFSATSAKDIAERAGIAVGAMYHHYKSKEEVYAALLQAATKELDGIHELTAKELMAEIENELKESLDFARWISILPADYFRQMVDAFAKNMPRKEAENLVANILGRCKLQLILEGENND